MSKALDAFAATSDRVIALFEHQSAVRKARPADGRVCDDIVRACVVLVVAAMDSYFTRKFAEVLVPFLKSQKSPPKDLVTLLAHAGLDTEQALVMLGMDRPYRRILTLVRGHLSRYTTQHFDKIDELFACLGVKGLCEHCQGKTKRKRLLESIRILVKRRHEIVHEGDLNDHGKLRPVKEMQLVKRMRDLVFFIDAADDIIDSVVKAKSGKKAAARRRKAAGA